MARYRKGDRYLSEEEYRAEEDINWIVVLFIIGAGLSGYYTYVFIADFELEKWVRFSIIIFVAFLCGFILAKLYKQIQALIGITIIISLIYFFGNLLWNNI